MKFILKFIRGMVLIGIGVVLMRNFLGMSGEVTILSFIEGVGALSGAVIGTFMVFAIVTLVEHWWG